ncbi:DUF6401 family natural product biosynthesis protein [Saccharomonospora sp. NB11]|jgi:hypothetical protein|uniref:DUF6401 family natural product biosynthesis protein n=1 Tax=Saccharomonospora sp. NB11 TaxID=1642298 RepID=UPI0018D045CC|nr:DUF6401 family natural product biosynthesis protein [Saccharomonospora sp. NB11]
MSSLTGAQQVAFARRDLDALTRRLRAAGVTASTLGPAQLAGVDQHAAAVRDILSIESATFGVVELAAYAQGVLDGAAEADWTPETHFLSSCPTGEWIVLRLLAVCALADAQAGDDVPDIDPLLFS